MTAARYAFYPQRGELDTWYTENPAQRFRAEFTPRGLLVTTNSTDGGTLSVGMSLRSVGYGVSQKSVRTARAISATDRFELSRSAIADTSLTVSEWYVNTQRGLEQSFSLDRPPGDNVGGEPLRLTLSLEGELTARVADDGQAITFTDASARPLLRYEKLAVTDARGRRLAARMDTSGSALWLDVDDRDALWPITIDPTFTLQQKLLAPGLAEDDQFGWAVAISGDTVVVGAPERAGLLPPSNDAGSVYVFVRTGTLWVHQQTLVPSDGAGGDRFGSSVAIDGDTLVVGAREADGPSATDQGAAYVFVRTAGVWIEQAPRLVAPDAETNDYFGHSVAVDDGTIVVGALIGGPPDQGAAYVFVPGGVTWILQQQLLASDATVGGQGDFFGASVSISGDTVAIGAFGDDIGQSPSRGSAYVFVRNGGVWSEQAKLLASDGADVDLFGHSVALSGNTLVIGAPRVDLAAVGIDVGAAYVFVRNGGVWNEQQKLLASDPGIHDELGLTVAMSGSTIVLSADLDNTDPLFDQGSAYVFSLANGIWTETQKLVAPDAASKDQFGYSVAVSGQTIVVGAPFDDGAAADQGSAYVFANTPPQIAAAVVSRPQGTSESGVAIAAVSDTETAASELIVAINGSTTATVNGVTVGTLAVSSSGQVTAAVAATCSASTANFTLRVTDTGGLFAEDTLTVTVTPSQPPVLLLNAPLVLWPPDHRYQLVPVSAMVASAIDDCDGNVAGNVVIEKVTSDEHDDLPGGSDGVTSSDIVIAANCRATELRAERDAAQNGRVYSITLRAADSSGNVATAVFRVSVPHDQQRAAIEDVPALTVIGCSG